MGKVGTSPGGGQVTVTGLQEKDIRSGTTVTVQQGNKLIARAHGKLTLKRVQVLASDINYDQWSVDIKRFVPKDVWPTLTDENFAFGSVSHRVNGWTVENDPTEHQDKDWHGASLSYNKQNGILTVRFKSNPETKIAYNAWGQSQCTVSVDCFYLGTV